MNNWLLKPKQTVRGIISALSLIMLALLVGCATYPMGLTKEQWEALPPDQQAEYRAKQAEIDAQQRAEREARFQEQKRVDEERRQQAEERLRAIYANPQYGDIITVQIEGGEIGTGVGAGERYPYQPVRFELAKGETKWIKFVRQDARGVAIGRDIAMSLEQDGSIFYFDRNSRSTIRINNDGWQSGRTYQPQEIKDTQFSSGARNVRIDIRFKDVTASAR